MLYDLAIVIYDFIVHLAAPFSRKPRKMMKGHWVVYELLRQQVEKGEQYIWFHAASLGEFEQGRPLIEMIREKYPFLKQAETDNYQITPEYFAFERFDEDDVEGIWFAANRTDHEVTLTVPERYKEAEVVYNINNSTKDKLAPCGVIALKI